MSCVTVVIPNYNGEVYLGEAIESVLSQQGVNLEVIVGDDGSADGSRKIIDSFGSAIRSVFQENRGATFARNVGLNLAQGDYVKFLDSDDRLLPSALAEQIAFRREFVRPELDRTTVTFGNLRLTKLNQAQKQKDHFEPLSVGMEFSLLDLISRSPITTMPLHPVELARSVGGFNAELGCAQEYDFHLRLFFAGARFIYDGVLVYEYRQHTKGPRLSSKALCQNELSALLQSYCRHVDCYDILAEELSEEHKNEIRRAFATNFWHSGRRAVRSNQFEMAKGFFKEARSLSSKPEAGSWLYRTLCRIFGPQLAENLASAAHGRFSEVP